MKLCLGVLEMPEPNGVDTYEVAQFLEGQYDLYSVFAEYEMDNIAKYLEEGVVGALQAAKAGVSIDPFAGAMQKIETDFKEFLDTTTAEQYAVSKSESYPVPTKSALAGKSTRFKGGKGARRPSFVDSGIQESAFRAWIEK